MGDAVTAALLKEAGQAGGARPAGFPVEGAAERAYRMERRADTLRGELANPELMGGESARPHVERELAAMGQQPPAAPVQPVAAPQQEAANDPVTAALLREAAPTRKGMEEVPGTPEHDALLANRPKAPGMGERVLTAASAGPLGPLEAGASVVSGAVGNVLGAGAGLVKGLFGGKYGTPEGAQEAAAYAREVAGALSYQPRTAAAKEILGTVGQLAEQSGATRLAGLGPAEGMALGNAISQMPKGAISQGTKLALGADKAPTAAPAAAAPSGGMASVGAAGVAPTEQVRELASRAQTPELRQVIERSAKGATPRTVATASRIVDADSLPVPIKLTAGQATQDVSLLSQEQNARGTKPAIANRFNEQNTQLGENLREIRDRAAPDVFATSRPAMGETLIDAYKAKDAALNKTISANYKALKDANGGAFPMDAKTFADNAYKKLHADLKAEFVPAGIEKQLEGFAKGKPMTFEQFESMRTNLANVMRSNADGNAKQAAALIRDALEELPMPPGAEHLKPLADTARASARERFALIGADPAYKAVVRGKASADRFLDKFVLNADKAAVETMKANLAHDTVAQQTMTAGALRRLQDRAGLIDYAGNFSPAGYNKALEGLGPKLGILFEPESKNLVEQLGKVAGYVKGQPTGSFVNNSNTAVTLLGEAAKSSAAGAANVAAGGVPIGTWTRKIAGFVKEQKDLNRSLQTGAGLKLKDVGK